MSARFTGKHAFRNGWRWAKPIDQWFEQELGNLLEPSPRPIVHVCSGSSRLGEVRVDAVHDAANLRADMFQLPFKAESVGTVICDPPYELNLQERWKLGFELARIMQHGGRLLWKAPWLPPEGKFNIDRVEVCSLRVGMPRNAHLLVRAERRFPGPKVGRVQMKAAERQEVAA